MAERATFFASSLHRVDELDNDQAILIEPLAVGLHAAGRLGYLAGKAVAIIGGGTIGLLSAVSAKAFGASEVALFTRYPHQEELAGRLGTTNVHTTAPGNDARYEGVIDSVASV